MRVFHSVFHNTRDTCNIISMGNAFWMQAYVISAYRTYIDRKLIQQKQS